MLFPVELFADLLGDSYVHSSLDLDPRRLGWPVARARRYTVFMLQSCSSSTPSLELLRPLLEATSAVGPGELFAVEARPPDCLMGRERAALTAQLRTRSNALAVLSTLRRTRSRERVGRQSTGHCVRSRARPPSSTCDQPGVASQETSCC